MTAVLVALEEWARLAVVEFTVVAIWDGPIGDGDFDRHGLEPGPDPDFSTATVTACPARVGATATGSTTAPGNSTRTTGSAYSRVVGTSTAAPIALGRPTIPCCSCGSSSTAGCTGRAATTLDVTLVATADTTTEVDVDGRNSTTGGTTAWTVD